jgi:2,5-diketo-D-gluconate reductase B
MIKSLPLNDVASIPVLGLGTWNLTGDECVEAVSEALQLGYCLLDTADAYGNHPEVASGIQASGVKREDIFITTKVWKTDLAHDPLVESADRFLIELATDHIDLLLVHWPNSSIPIDATLRAMEELRRAGKVRAIGVSNFTIPLMTEALATGIEVVNDQVEVRPSLNQAALREFCKNRNVTVTAYSSLKGGSTTLPIIVELAKKYERTPAQIIINWVIARGMIAIPKSAHKARIKENLKSVDFDMEEADLAQIDAVPQD